MIQRLRLNEIQNGKVINADDLGAELDQLVVTSNAQQATLGEITGQAMVLAGQKTFSGGVKVDTITPATTGGTVLVDQLELSRSANPTTPQSGQLWFLSPDQALRVQGDQGGQFLQMAPLGYVGGPAPLYQSGHQIRLPQGMTALDATGQAMLTITGSSGLTVDLDDSGAAGLDTGTKQANQWYYLWLCRGASGTTAVASLSRTVPVLPTGYDTYKRRLPIAIKTVEAGNILNFRVLHWPLTPLVLFTAVSFDLTGVPTGNTLVLTHGTSTAFTTIDIGQFVPDVADVAVFQVTTRSNSVWLRRNAGSGNGMRFAGVGGYDNSQMVRMVVNGDGTLQYRVDANSTHIAVLGFYVNPNL